MGPPRLGRKELRVFLALLGSAQQHGLGVGLGCSGFSQRWRGVRQDAGRAQAGVSQMERGGGLGCWLTSGGPGEVCGAPPGRPGYRARAAGMPALVEDGGRGWGGCSCPGRFPPAMWDGAGKAAKRPPPPHSGSQRGEEWELPCPPWARGWAPLGDRSGPVPFPKHGLCTPTGRAVCRPGLRGPWGPCVCPRGNVPPMPAPRAAAGLGWSSSRVGPWAAAACCCLPWRCCPRRGSAQES